MAERISSLARLLRQAVLVDYGGDVLVGTASHGARESAEQSFPRVDIEKVLGDVLVEQALRQPLERHRLLLGRVFW